MKRVTIFAAMLCVLVAALLFAGCGPAEEKAAEEKPAAEAQTPAEETAPAEEAAKPEPVKLTYANFPPAFTVPCVQMERWKDEVEARTDGAVLVETFPGGTLLKAKNMLRGVIEGQADIGCVGMSYQPGVFPLSTAVEMPVGFTSGKATSQTLWAIFNKYQPAELDDVVVLTMFATPPSSIMSNDPITSLADMQGLELRGSGTPGKFLEALGAVTVSMPMPEVPDALQKNIVKGVFTSLEVLMDMKFAEFCPNVTITNGPVYLFAVVMNKAKWESLPMSSKQVIADLAAEQAAWTGNYWDEHSIEAVEWAKENHGLQVHELSAADQAQALALSAGIIEAWTARATEAGIPAAEVLADVLAFKEQFSK